MARALTPMPLRAVEHPLPAAGMSPGSSATALDWDLDVDDTCMQVTLDTPGVDCDDVAVTCRDDRLTITVRRDGPSRAGQSRRRWSGTRSATIPLPEPAAGPPRWHLHDGVLDVTLDRT